MEVSPHQRIARWHEHRSALFFAQMLDLDPPAAEQARIDRPGARPQQSKAQTDCCLQHVGPDRSIGRQHDAELEHTDHDPGDGGPQSDGDERSGEYFCAPGNDLRGSPIQRCSGIREQDTGQRQPQEQEACARPLVRKRREEALHSASLRTSAVL